MPRLRWTGRGGFSDARTGVAAGPGHGPAGQQSREVDVDEETAERLLGWDDWERVDESDADADATAESESASESESGSGSGTDATNGGADDEPSGSGSDTPDGDGVAEPPVDPSDLTVDSLEERLEAGDYSADELDAIEAAEQSRSGGARKTALEAIEEERNDDHA